MTRWWWVRGIAHAEVVTLVALAYLSYLLAEYIETSGIMSIFICAMM